jgi:hypothetical protein
MKFILSTILLIFALPGIILCALFMFILKSTLDAIRGLLKKDV